MSDDWLVELFGPGPYPEPAPVPAHQPAPPASRQAPVLRRTVCPRCSGAGIIEQYRRVNGGHCFQCGGSGFL